ncbi:MAG: ABC transporter permease [Verrucomicrobiota bacterium]|nr:ABC transporter permease [Verrucomicrobiota bacterium]
MQAFLTLTRRELASFFVSLAGYIIIALSTFQMGLSFFFLLKKLQAQPTPMPITELFYMTPFFWLILLLSAPVITMRLFALEKYSGTFETLMTAPVSDWQVVLAKFTAALIFFMLMWLPLLGCIFLLSHFTSDPMALDSGALGSTFLGIFLLGSLFMAIGCFASALTRSQIIAAMITLAISFTFFLLSFFSERLPLQKEWMNDALNYVDVVGQMQDFSRGIVDTRSLSFYFSATIFFLFLTYRVVESRRWK